MQANSFFQTQPYPAQNAQLKFLRDTDTCSQLYKDSCFRFFTSLLAYYFLDGPQLAPTHIRAKL